MIEKINSITPINSNLPKLQSTLHLQEGRTCGRKTADYRLVANLLGSALQKKRHNDCVHIKYP